MTAMCRGRTAAAAAGARAHAKEAMTPAGTATRAADAASIAAAVPGRSQLRPDSADAPGVIGGIFLRTRLILFDCPRTPCRVWLCLVMSVACVGDHTVT